MPRPLGGYTVIEVLIVLAVSSVLLATSIVVVRGQQAHTEFTNSMNDVNTKMQQWVDQVVNGLSGSTAEATQSFSNYNCDLDSDGYPRLTTPSLGTGRERGTNPACIFLGKALHLNTDDQYNDRILAYSIIGRRTYTPSGGSQTIVDNLANAKPAPAIFSGPGGNIDLTEEYKVPNGARIRSVSSTSTYTTHSHMAGLFNGFSTSNTSVGSQSLLAVSYPLDGNFAPRAQAVIDCIKLINSSVCVDNGGSPPPPNLWPMSRWYICFESTANDETAQLSIISFNGQGAATKLEFIPCGISPD